MVDRTPEELVGKKLLEVMPENKEHGLFDKYVEVVNSGEPLTLDINYEDETLNNWFRIQAVKLEDGLVTTFFDISNLKKIESDLLRKEKLLSEALDLANLGSWSWDLKDNSITWSSALLQIYGIEESDFKPTYDYFINSIHADDRQAVESTLKEAMDSVKSYEIGYRIGTPPMVKYLEARAVPKVQADGTLIEYVGIIKDLTAEKIQQQVLRQSQQKAQRIEKVASSERMARSIAHEIRNPLTNIALASEQLRTEPDQESKELFLDMISRNGQRIEDLIKKLMDSSQQAVLDISDQDINKIIDDAIIFAQDRIELRGVEVKRDYDPEMCSIKVDGDKVKMALLNIIINAIEAVDENGTLEITTQLTDTECIVVISDNGIGIEESKMGQLFDPFFTGKQGGLGLGLTTTLNILNSHDANVEVESTLGEGTTFTISFQR